MDECLICRNIIDNQIEIINCKHKFCYNCLVNWLKEKQICPLCKNNIDCLSNNGKKLSIWDIIDYYDTINVDTYDELSILVDDLPKYLKNNFCYLYFYNDLKYLINEKIGEVKNIFEIIKVYKLDKDSINVLDENWCLLSNIQCLLNNKEYETINDILGYEEEDEY